MPEVSRRALIAISAVSAVVLALLGTAVVAVLSGGGSAAGPMAGLAPGNGAWPDSSCSQPSEPGQVVTFTARDMGTGGAMMGGTAAGPMMFMPRVASVPSGTVTVVLVNAGSRPHELLVFPLTAGQVAGQRPVGTDDRIAETGVVGEVQAVCPPDAGTDGIVPGGNAQVTLTLAPGRYEVVCNLPGHYRHGMSAALTVT
ncbi:MAG TPA: sulfocyanin-like copper-binding protein [Actinomycetes bacterium]